MYHTHLTVSYVVYVVYVLYVVYVVYVPYAPYGIIRSVRTRPLLTYRSTEPGEARKLLQLATHSAAYGVTAVFHSQ